VNKQSSGHRACKPCQKKKKQKDQKLKTGIIEPHKRKLNTKNHGVPLGKGGAGGLWKQHTLATKSLTGDRSTQQREREPLGARRTNEPINVLVFGGGGAKFGGKLRWVDKKIARKALSPLGKKKRS